jgi:hypothetical protein
MTSRWVREDHRCGSSNRNGPDSKRNACATVYSSEHETSPQLQVSSCMQSYPDAFALKLPNCGDLVAMW